MLFVSPVTIASGRISLFRQVTHHFKELLVFLADEESIRHETIESGHGARILRRRRADDRDRREVFVQKVSRLGHDQVGLQSIPLQGFRVRFALRLSQVSKRNLCARSARSVVRIRNRKRVAGLVLPSLKVHRFAGPDTEQNSQDFRITDLLSERRVEAGAALLDKREMKTSRERDRLQVGGYAFGVVAAQRTPRGVRIRSGNRRVLPDTEARHCLHERRTAIDVGVRYAAVPRPKAGVHGELRQVGEPQFLAGPLRCAAGDRGKATEVHRLRPLRFQIRFQKSHVADFVVGVVGDVLDRKSVV